MQITEGYVGVAGSFINIISHQTQALIPVLIICMLRSSATCRSEGNRLRVGNFLFFRFKYLTVSF